MWIGLEALKNQKVFLKTRCYGCGPGVCSGRPQVIETGSLVRIISVISSAYYFQF